MRQLQKLIPPVYLVLSLAGMTILHYTFPIVILIAEPYSYTGIAIIVSGLCITIISAATFRKAGTPVLPFEKSTTLVAKGLFGYTRNPMYLGMLLILLGTAIVLGSLAPIFIIPVFFLIIQEGYIKHEEKFLEKIFGEAYLQYKEKVRRWF